MQWALLLAIMSVSGQEPPVDVKETPKEQDTDVDVEEKGKDIKDLKDCILGLEFYILDKKEYKEYCPGKEWEQPSIDKYKEKPQSYLPEGCKPEPPEE